MPEYLQQPYSVGDFVELNLSGNRSMGIVRSVLSPSKIEVRSFSAGELPVDAMVLSSNVLKILSPQEGLGRFREIHAQFEQEIKTGNLLGAVAARKQFHLDQLLENVGKDLPIVDALNKAHLEPSTGVYVIAGNYSISGLCLDEPRMQGLVIMHEPKILYEDDASALLKILFPKGLGDVPPILKSPEPGHCIDALSGYHAFEVPQRAVGLVTKMRKLFLTLR